MNQIRGNALIVEDDVDCGEVILRTLTRAGYGVRWVRCRHDASVAMQQYFYDYVIMDDAMTGTSIEEFVALCQEKACNIILTSAAGDPEQQAQRLGLSHWLAKPFTPEQLMTVLRGLSSGVRKAIPRA